MKKVMRKIFYYVELKNTSPIHIGNGDNTNTDLDVILDKEGMFYIPGSSMAGSILHYLNEEERKLVLPELTIEGEKDKQTIQSPVFFSDAFMIKDDGDKQPSNIEKRDGIRLDANKVTIKNNKYDYEIVPRGNVFQWRIEVTDRTGQNDLEEIIEKVIGAIQNEEIKIGYKTTRGLGNLRVEKFGKKVFDQGNIQEIFNFDPYEFDQYIDQTVIIPKDYKRYTVIELDLALRSGLSIRTYNTQKGVEDYEHIHSAGVPVIPGTSWNGLIRRCFDRYLNELNVSLNMDEIFGTASDNKIKSYIYVHEGVLDGTKEVTQTRIRINPFTGGTVNSALYQEKSCYKGNTTLKIMIDNRLNKNELDIIMKLFKIFVNDLNFGFAALGGETSIGRGLFTVTEVKIDNEHVDWVVSEEC